MDKGRLFYSQSHVYSCFQVFIYVLMWNALLHLLQFFKLYTLSNWTHPSGPCWRHATSTKLPFLNTVSLLWSLMALITAIVHMCLSIIQISYHKCVQGMFTECLIFTRCLARHWEYHVELDKCRHCPHFLKCFLFPILQLFSFVHSTYMYILLPDTVSQLTDALFVLVFFFSSFSLIPFLNT